MSLRSKLLGVGIAAAAFGLLSTSAMATVTVTASVGGAPTGAILDNLDLLSTGNATQNSLTGITVSFTGGSAAVTGASSGQYAPPAVSGLNGAGFGNGLGPDATLYLSSEPGGSITLNFNTEVKYVGLLWGSIDTYNSLELYDGATLVATISGTDAAVAAGTLPNGDQNNPGTAYVNINSTVQFDRIVALSTSPAFEFDNIAYNAQECTTPDCTQNVVPEPVTLSLFGAGLPGAAVLRRRKKKPA